MKNAAVFHQNTFPLFLLEIKFKNIQDKIYHISLLSYKKAIHFDYTLNLQKSLKIELRFHTLFYI